jgi:hypothetical protein
MNHELKIQQSFAKLRRIFGQQLCGKGRIKKCCVKRSMSNIYIGERGQPPMRGAASPSPFLLFMVVVTPSFMER